MRIGAYVALVLDWGNDECDDKEPKCVGLYRSGRCN